MEPRHFLLYWRPETADPRVADPRPLDRAASNQLDRARERDTVWIVTVRQGLLFLVGRVRVDHRTNRAGAITRLGTEDVWDAEHFAFTDSPEPIRNRDVTHLAHAIRFRGDPDRLTVDGGRVNAQQLQTMRELTPESAQLLAEAVASSTEPEPLASPTASLDDLRRRAIAAAQTVGDAGANAEGRTRKEYERSEHVREYVLRRADGTCEACREPAPFFRRSDGTPYLEPHHTLRVADGGPDHPRFVGALCPTCHARIHHGQDGEDLNRRLQEYLDQQEPEV